MIQLQIGDLVQVLRGEGKGMIARVNNVNDDRIFVVRIQEEIDQHLLPVMGDYNRTSLMKIYTDNELRYSAGARCDCGAGLAYAKGKSFEEVSCWDCADILTGRALKKDPECKSKHTGKMPFAFYEVLSEDQPSARGATTRPAKEDS